MSVFQDTVFVSYSHADARWLKRLRTHLAPLRRDQVLDLWDDTRIDPGEDWREEIENALARARVAVLLVSADFLASEFINSNELPRLLASAEGRGTVILPVIVKASRFADTPSLARFQAVNPPSRPLDGLRTAAREQVLVAVAAAVERALGTPSEFGGQPETNRHAMHASREASGRLSNGEDDERKQRTSDERGALRGVKEHDPVLFFAALSALPHGPESYEALLGTTHFSIAHDDALRAWLATDPERSGQLLGDTIRQCPVTGPGWFRAARAGQLFSRALRDTSMALIYDIVAHGEIEPKRHALVAYGHLGHSLSPELLREEILPDRYERQKALSYAVLGNASAYLSAAGWQISNSGDKLRRSMEWYWTEFENTHPKPEVDLRSVSSAHYDDLIGSWLDDKCPAHVMEAAATALGERGVVRAVPALSRLLAVDDSQIREAAARALGRIGGAQAAQFLFDLPRAAPHRQQIVHLAHEFDSQTMDELIQEYGGGGQNWTDTWLARSIGLADARRHHAVITNNLGSEVPAVRGVSAISAARMDMPEDLGRVAREAEPGAERAMATAALLMSQPADYAKVEATWRRDLVEALPSMPARLVEDVFQCVAEIPEADQLVEAWRPIADSWGARF